MDDAESKIQRALRSVRLDETAMHQIPEALDTMLKSFEQDPAEWTPEMALRRYLAGEPPLPSYSEAQREISQPQPPPPEHQPAVESFPWDWMWLRSKCARPNVDADHLAESVIDILSSSLSDDAIQEQLVAHLGYDDFELLMILIEKRKVIVEHVRHIPENSGQSPKPGLPSRSNSLAASQDAVNTISASTKKINPPTVVVTAPTIANQFSVMTESEKQMLKEQRKQEKRQRKNAAREDKALADTAEQLQLDGEELKMLRDQMLEANAQRPLASGAIILDPERPRYPHVYDTRMKSVQQISNILLTASSQRFALPAGTERRDTKEYEHISIPMAASSSSAFRIPLISISDIEPWAQCAFPGYTSLNRMQSAVYKTAFMTNENMLVCAPTGAGKTDVAMLTILSTLRSYLVQDGDGKTLGIRKNDFKIIYVAPMKALAAEIVRKFQKRLEPFGITVRELTGDMQLTKSEILATQMIVTTPEKWDVVSRKSTGDVELSMKVRLLIVDEVHLLHDDRGAVIESIIARTLRMVETTQLMIRIVGLSATLPNYIDVAEFLKVNPQQGLFYFDGTFRPVPLSQKYYGVKGGKATSSLVRERMDEVMFENIEPVLQDGRQVMVFVHARKDTIRTAFSVKELALQFGVSGLFELDPETVSTIKYQQLMKEVEKSRNRELKELAKFGIGIHNAGMMRSDRTLTERLFEYGYIKVLVCTATLAWGVNLPAHAVIIKGTQVYDQERGGFVDL